MYRRESEKIQEAVSVFFNYGIWCAWERRPLVALKYYGIALIFLLRKILV